MKKKPKNYYVTITHTYLLEAYSDIEAITKAKERYLGRPNEVYFDGMVVNATITKRIIPKQMVPKQLRKIVRQAAKYIIKKEDKIYGNKPNITRNRPDTKKSDYIHFGAADNI